MTMLHKPVYLDYHATTPVAPEVLEAMLPFFTNHFGNASSRSHSYGWQANEAVEMARSSLAQIMKVQPGELHFTSGSTEGLNMVLKGLATSLSSKGKHIITFATEHQAVLDPLEFLERSGYAVTRLPVFANGQADPDQLRNAITKDTIMVVAMWANNETGVIHDMSAIGSICNEKGIAFISDATQAIGKIPVEPRSVGVDVLVFSGHKFYGPKGTGAVYIAKNEKKLKPVPLLHGGGHEAGYRAGTLNTPGIVGLGKAATYVYDQLSEISSHIKNLRDRFETTVLSEIELAEVNGDIKSRLHTVSNLKIPYTDSQAVMTKFRSKLAISSGSACSSANPEPSHVLLAMGLSGMEAKASYRISFGMPSSEEEIDLALPLFINAINEYRETNPVWQMYKQGIDI